MGKKPRSYAKAVAELVFGILFLGWLLLVPSHPWLILGPGVWILKYSPYQLSPALMEFFWCVVALNVVQALGWKGWSTFIAERWVFRAACSTSCSAWWG